MRPPKFIPTCDSILIPNVASTLQWKRRRIRRVAWYAEDDFNVNPTSSLSCHVSCADFFRRRALFLPLTRRPATGIVGRLPRPPVCCMYNISTCVLSNVCSLECLFACGVACRVLCAGTFLCMRLRPYLSCSRRGVLAVAVASRVCGGVLAVTWWCDVSRLCGAIPWLRHADEC